MTAPQVFTCRGCGEHFPDDDSIWNHDCPVFAEEDRRLRPKLAAHRDIIKAYKSAPRDSWPRRLIDWGMQRAYGDDADVVDMIVAMPPKQAGRWARRLTRGGVVEPTVPRRSRLEMLQARAKVNSEPTNRFKL